MATDKFDKGMKLRKQVLGAEYVERSMASADDSACRCKNSRPSIAGVMCGRGPASRCAIAASSILR